MIYTIGNTKKYLRLLEEQDKVFKLGRSGTYPGGWVWKTRQEAEKAIESGFPGYSVFGVRADWVMDTSDVCAVYGDEGDLQILEDGGLGCNYLLVTSQIVLLDD